MTIVPAIANISLRVKKKNRIPDNAIVSLVKWSKNRFVSASHESEGTERNILSGSFDSSLMRAAQNDTTNPRMMRKTNENQK